MLLLKNSIYLYSKHSLSRGNLLNIHSIVRGKSERSILSPNIRKVNARSLLLRSLNLRTISKGTLIMISSYSRMWLYTPKLTYWSNWWGFNIECWLPWLSLVNWFMPICSNCCQELSRIFCKYFTIRPLINGLSIYGLLLAADRRSISGKFLSGSRRMKLKLSRNWRKFRKFYKKKSRKILSRLN